MMFTTNLQYSRLHHNRFRQASEHFYNSYSPPRDHHEVKSVASGIGGVS